MSKILLVGAEPDKMPRLKLVYKSLKTLGHDVKVFAPFQRKGNSIMRYLANMVKLLFEHSEEYHLFNIPDVIGFPLLIKRGRLVYDVRSPWREVVLDSTGNKFLAGLAGIIERVFCLKADAVISANPLLGERAKMFGAKEVVNVPNFPYEEMNTDGWEGIVETLRGLRKKQEGVVMFFGKISIPEGSDILADVIIETLKIDYALFGVRFIIAGDGPELENLKEKIRKAGVMDRVHFLGWVPHEKMGMWIRAVDLCIMPREEGGTTKWMHPDCIWKVNESVSIGTAVLATEYGGFKLENMFTPLYITKNKYYPDTIIQMLKVALRWGSPDSKLSIKRDWKSSREQLEKVYGNVQET
jgi:glycosyltransferase involved in cell wall biosynthesis